MEHPNRKRNRLAQYDYSSHGAYFLTLCTHQKQSLFGAPDVKTPAREIIIQIFFETLANYPQMKCPCHVVMPDHFHALIVINNPDGHESKTIAEMMRSFKSRATVAYIRLVKDGVAQPFAGKLWQRSYYDHVIRNQRDFEEIWKYIEENPIRWQMKRETE